MDGRPNSRNKAAFSNFSGVIWTLGLTLVLTTCDNAFKICNLDLY